MSGAQGIGITALSQVCLRVRDPQASLRFYAELLGLRRLFDFPREDGSVFLHYLEITPGQYLELMPSPAFERGAGCHHLTFLVEDVAAAAARLLDAGLALYDGPASAGRQLFSPRQLRAGGDGNPAFYLEDPDGNNIELMQFVEGNMQSRYAQKSE